MPATRAQPRLRAREQLSENSRQGFLPAPRYSRRAVRAATPRTRRRNCDASAPHASDRRFTAKDPILFDGGDTNLYGYIGADPINLTDPTGKTAGVAGGLIAIGGFCALQPNVCDAVRVAAVAGVVAVAAYIAGTCASMSTNEDDECQYVRELRSPSYLYCEYQCVRSGRVVVQYPPSERTSCPTTFNPARP